MDGGDKYKNDVYLLPKPLDEKGAQLLSASSVSIDPLTDSSGIHRISPEARSSPSTTATESRAPIRATEFAGFCFGDFHAL